MTSLVLVSICLSSLWLSVPCEVQVCTGQGFRLYHDGSNTGMIEGMVQMCYRDEWNILCPQTFAFTRKEATVLCKGLGLPVDHAMVLNYTMFLVGNETALDFKGTRVEFNCRGNESSLTQCVDASRNSSVGECNRPVAALCTNAVPVYRLTDGLTNQGRIEVSIKSDNDWAPICADDFTISDVNVTCANLGQPTADIRPLAMRRKSGTSPMLGGLRCAGMEASLEDCPSVVWGPVECPGQRDAAVLCDTVQDRKYRLMSGNSTSAGRVEWYFKERWGTVCNHHFDRNAARVICSHLGLDYTNARVVGSGKYGLAEGIVWLDNVKCKGTESNLMDCVPNFTGQPISNCFHEDDAAVSCESYRLVGGNPGKLQISYEGEWIGIIATSFNMAAATVACRSMGQPRSGAKFESGLMDQDSGIILELKSCKGSEDTFLDCEYRWWNTADLHEENITIDEVYLTCGEEAPSNVEFRHPGNDQMGVYEVSNGTHWGTICGNALDNVTARIACGALNLGTSFAASLPTNYVPKANGSVILDGLTCQGDETSLANCDHNPWGVITCDPEHQEDFVIYCGTVEDNFDLRLGDGKEDIAGRLEIKIYGKWGTVCETGFDRNAATVACRQLGLSVFDARVTSMFGSGEGMIWLHSVNCTGEEDNIKDCRRGPLGQSECEHVLDIGVICGAVVTESSTLSGGAIAGVVIALIIIFALLGVGLCFGIRKWSQARRDLGQNLLNPPTAKSLGGGGAGDSVKFDNQNGVVNMGFNDSPKVSHIPLDDRNGHGSAIRQYPPSARQNGYATPSRMDRTEHQYDALSEKKRLPSDAEKQYGAGNGGRYPRHDERPYRVNKSYTDQDDDGGFGTGYPSPRSPKGEIVFDPSLRGPHLQYGDQGEYEKSQRVPRSSRSEEFGSDDRGKSPRFPSRESQDDNVSHRPSRSPAAVGDYSPSNGEPTYPYDDDVELPPRYETVESPDYRRNYSPSARSPARPEPEPSPSYGGLPFHGGTSV